MKRKLLLIPLALLLAVSLVSIGCPAPAPAPAPAIPSGVTEEIAELEGEVAAKEKEIAGLQKKLAEAEGKVYEWKLQHSASAGENYIMDKYVDIVETMSGGRIKISVFSSGEIVTWDELLDATGAGIVDIGVTFPDFVGGMVPIGQLESAPLIWRTFGEKEALLYKYGLEDLYRDAFEAMFNIRVLGVEAGAQGATIYTKQINTLADLKGLRIHVWEPYGKILNELTGSIASPIAAEEIYTSLALGVLDGAEWAGAGGMVDLGLQEVGTCFLQPYHQSAYSQIFTMNREIWDELPADLQAILIEAVCSHSTWFKASNTWLEIHGLKTMEEYGVTTSYLPDEDVEAIFQKSLDWVQNDFSQMSPYCKEAADMTLTLLRDTGRLD